MRGRLVDGKWFSSIGKGIMIVEVERNETNKRLITLLIENWLDEWQEAINLGLPSTSIDVEGYLLYDEWQPVQA